MYYFFFALHFAVGFYLLFLCVRSRNKSVAIVLFMFISTRSTEECQWAHVGNFRQWKRAISIRNHKKRRKTEVKKWKLFFLLLLLLLCYFQLLHWARTPNSNHYHFTLNARHTRRKCKSICGYPWNCVWVEHIFLLFALQYPNARYSPSWNFSHFLYLLYTYTLPRKGKREKKEKRKKKQTKPIYYILHAYSLLCLFTHSLCLPSLLKKCGLNVWQNEQKRQGNMSVQTILCIDLYVLFCILLQQLFFSLSKNFMIIQGKLFAYANAKQYTVVLYILLLMFVIIISNELVWFSKCGLFD